MDYDVHQFRQKDFLPPELLQKKVYLIGVGGIGSPTAMILSKMGFQDIIAYDPDTVEDQNVGSQIYHSDQVDQPKVKALERFVEDITAIPTTFPPKGLTLTPFSIVISGVDAMSIRQDIWRYLKTQKLVSLYIDARMGLEIIRIYALDPSDPKQVKLYEGNLYPDEEGEPLPCSAKAVAYNGFFAASVIGALVSAHLRGVQRPLEVIGDMSEFRLTPTL